MLDDIFKHLYSRTADEEWTSLEKLDEILETHGLAKKETERVMHFLASYFLDVDEIGRRVRLSSWAHNFFQVSTP